MKEIVSPPPQRTCLKLGLLVAVGDVGSPGRGAGGGAGSGVLLKDEGETGHLFSASCFFLPAVHGKFRFIMPRS